MILSFHGLEGRADAWYCNSPVYRGLAVSKGRGDINHEVRHLVLNLGIRLQTDVEIEDDLVETGCLDIYEGGDECRRQSCWVAIVVFVVVVTQREKAEFYLPCLRKR